MASTRTGNSLKNIIAAFINQGLVTLLTFITRTVLIEKLGSEYVGVNGLFTNIITVLSLAELGINMAIPFSLYKPLAERDTNKINILMKFYSKIYLVIGITVLGIGAALTPFLPHLVNEMPDIADIRIIYLLFVFNSGISYFWAYKGLLISSDQKAYILSKINNFISVSLAVSQCVVLVITHNFIAYLLCNCVLTLAKNWYISYQCDKMYPYIKYKCKEKLQKSELEEIKKNVFSVCLYRIGTVLLNSTDGIIISKFISVIVNGYYSNYTMITNALNSVLSQISNGVVASIGNATATESKDYNHQLFQRLDFINYWLYGVCTICLWVMMNPFIKIWIGEQYQLDSLTVWAISMNFYTLGMLSINTAFRNTYGLFWYGKLRPLVMSVINIALDILLVTRVGVFGVVFATLIARVTTTVWYDPYIVFKHGFQKSPKEYYCTYMQRILVINVTGLLFLQLMKNITVNGWLIWVGTACIVFVLSNLIFLLFYARSDEFAYACEKVKSVMQKIIKRRDN